MGPTLSDGGVYFKNIENVKHPKFKHPNAIVHDKMLPNMTNYCNKKKL